MSDPTTRALTLLGLLESRATWAGPELAERLGVTTRTVRRDVERLRSLGYTVDAEAGAEGGYSLGRGQVLPPLLLDEEEAVAVTLGLVAEAVQRVGVHSEAAQRALTKIDGVTPGPLRHRLRGLRDALVLPSGPPVVDGDLLMTCADAVRRQVRLTFGYTDRRGVVTTRTVEPHRLVSRGRGWVLVAWDRDRADWRTFRLDRLRDAEVTTWRFSPRPGLDAALARLDGPMPASAWRHRVVVHVHAPLAAVAASLPTEVPRLRALDEHTTEFTSGADDPATAARWIAAIDHEITVVGDEAIRAAVGSLAARLTRSVKA
ncbi:helix-turn-helix transcriptional regulator [Nigerium massiliense]|uniref:helix-turn-helix transcriptional regulator n=1 Tax=Nigerium massiliense TaxID=1522317 RepID=UPI00058AFFEF|nr:WYL domain-containing protein [Nigerium massiliense]